MLQKGEIHGSHKFFLRMRVNMYLFVVGVIVGVLISCESKFSLQLCLALCVLVIIGSFVKKNKSPYPACEGGESYGKAVFHVCTTVE